MDTNSSASVNLTPKNLSDVIIRLGLSIVLLVFCIRIFSPFMGLMLWALILGISLYPVHQMLATKVGGQGKASIVIVLLFILILDVPLGVVATSFLKDSQDTSTAIDERNVSIPLPSPSVAEWPVIGEKVYEAWNEAATNMPEFQEHYRNQLDSISEKLVNAGISAIGTVFLFTGAFIIAGIMMAYGQAAHIAMEKIFVRFSGRERGPELHKLSIATVRSVAVGVVGVAFFQSLLFGICFILAGIPFPGLLALAVLITGIIQLPALIFGLPAIAYIWMGGNSSPTMSVVLTVFFIIASLSDNVLKPMMLGRGVKSPLPIILIGALGGMFTAGFVGLFIGSVIFAVAYEIFITWVDETEIDPMDVTESPMVNEPTVPNE